MSTFGSRVRRGLSWLLLVGLFAMIVSLTRSLLGYAGVGERLEQAQEQVDSLMNENVRLNQELSAGNEDFVVEKHLRDSLGYSKEGEYVVVIDEEVLKQAMTQQVEDDAQVQLPIWREWWSLFF